MTISQAARRSGLPAKTIRYYEDIGLAEPSARGENGYRYYDDAAVHELNFIKRARDLGFSIEDTQALLGLWRDQGRRSSEVKALATRRMADIAEKIEALESMRRTLSRLVDSCHGDERAACPILDDLAHDTEQKRDS